MPKKLASSAPSTTSGGKVEERVQENSLSRVRRALEKNAEGKQEILLIRFSRVAEDEISGFLKTRDRQSKVFLTDFVAKKTASGTIEYLDIDEMRIRLARRNRVPSTAKRRFR
ncbi:MAG: hypothetical protein AUJ08_04975 [Thaumarchaeota archaeon 13_1_40CM_3_50_5]|nr:MAG: hypothetical protein AUJ08_04975 [Thaumarchaeota archaeon 13_1_40CM_3_50_5]